MYDFAIVFIRDYNLHSALKQVVEAALEGCLLAYVTLRAYNKDDSPGSEDDMPDIRTVLELLHHVLLSC